MVMIIDKNQSVSSAVEVFGEVLPHLRIPLLPDPCQGRCERWKPWTYDFDIGMAPRAMPISAQREPIILFIKVYYVHT